MSPTQFFLKYQMNLQLLMVPRLLCALLTRNSWIQFLWNDQKASEQSAKCAL